LTKAQKLVQQLTSEVEGGRLDWRDALVQLAEGLKPRRRSKQKCTELPVPEEGLNVWSDDLLDVVKRASKATTTTLPIRTGWGGWGNMGTTPAPPALRSLHLEGKECLDVRATKEDIGFHQRIRAKGNLPPVCPEAAMLKSVLRRLPKHAVVNLQRAAVDRDEYVLRIECEGVVTSLETIPADEFPQPEEDTIDSDIVFNTQELREAVAAVLPAASADKTRPILTGVLFRRRERAIDLVATDTRQLAIVMLGVEVQEGEDRIVPVDALALWLSVAAKAAETGLTFLAIGKKRVHLSDGNSTVWAKPIEGQFPNYDKVIPPEENMQCRITFNRKSMLEAIDRLTPIAAEANGRIIFKLNEAALRLTTSSIVDGSAEAEVPARWTGEAESFALNYRFLARGLEMFDSEEVTLEYEAPERALMLRRDDRQYLLMPMRMP